jgi:hypothetical protein
VSTLSCCAGYVPLSLVLYVLHVPPNLLFCVMQVTMGGLQDISTLLCAFSVTLATNTLPSRKYAVFTYLPLVSMSTGQPCVYRIPQETSLLAGLDWIRNGWQGHGRPAPRCQLTFPAGAARFVSDQFQLPSDMDGAPVTTLYCAGDGFLFVRVRGGRLANADSTDVDFIRHAVLQRLL